MVGKRSAQRVTADVVPSHTWAKWPSGQFCELRKNRCKCSCFPENKTEARRYRAAHQAQLGSRCVYSKPTAHSVPASCCISYRSDEALDGDPAPLDCFLSSPGKKLQWLHFPRPVPGGLASWSVSLNLWYLLYIKGPGLFKVLEMGFNTHFSFTSQASDLVGFSFE